MIGPFGASGSAAGANPSADRSSPMCANISLVSLDISLSISEEV